MTCKRSIAQRWAAAVAAAFLLGVAPAAVAQRVADIEITQAQALPSIPGARNGGGFLTVVNHGNADDRIVAASSPACGHVELHTMRMEDNVMRMREVSDIPVPAGKTLRMQPGSGYHLMLMDLKQPLTVGAVVPVDVKFARAGVVHVDLKVEPRDKIGGAAGAAGHAMH
ncbi:copper chaperone PCu(A)C [Thiomonas sp.]|uniref:copper chaperone PCu(A)C n=1 Tax=Thiomonas sp. TaxID=2047785 RepID=UPI002612C401|nr:copper chaperone PCu(A)C [Thiomonas sp.]